MDFLNKKYNEFAKSEHYFNLRVFVNILTGCLVVIVYFYQNSISLAVLLFVLPIVAFVLNEISIYHRKQASKLRRYSLLEDSLGYKPSDVEIAQTNLDIKHDKVLAKEIQNSYFGSKKSPGYARLLDNIAESAFFTKNLSAKYFWWLIIILGIIFTVVMTFMIFSLVSGLNTGLGKIIGKIGSVVVLYLLAGDIAFMIIRYRYQLRECEIVLAKCDKLLKQYPLDISAVIELLVRYNCSADGALVIPEKLYLKHRESLNKSWQIYLDAPSK